MRLLAVVAHPDDETFGCGSVLLHARAAGLDTAVVCATRGEAGESRLPTARLGDVREAELRAAATILGVGDVRLLGYRDSGMDGEPTPGTLAAADPAEVTTRVREAIDVLRPDVVVTPDGSDGHRDHLVVRDATLAAVDDAAAPPATVYLWCLARSSMRRWAEHQRRAGAGEAYLALGELGTPDEEITTVLDVRAHRKARQRAIAVHRSQTSPFEGLPAELQEDFLGTDRLRLVRGADVLAGQQ